MLKKTRLLWLDEARGFAVIMMIVFHFAYDLKLFQLASLNFNHGFWFGFPRFIAGSFLFCVGISLEYTHATQIQWHSFLKRTGILLLSALIISIATYIQYPDQWVFFGTLQCIAASSMLGLLFIGKPRLQIITALLIIILQYIFNYDIEWVSALINKPSMDFIPVYPWFWVVLSGMIFSRYINFKNQLLPTYPHYLLSFLGQHSLVIYLIHQPILFSIAWSIKTITQS